MGVPIVLAGAHIKLYMNNKVYKVAQNVTFTVDYDERGIHGIDAMYAQEIASNKITVSGNVNGLRVKQSGGLQAEELRPLFQDAAAAPYVSLRIQDRSTGEDIIFIPNCKVSNEGHTAAVKGTYKLNFSFVGQIPLFALDRSSS